MTETTRGRGPGQGPDFAPLDAETKAKIAALEAEAADLEEQVKACAAQVRQLQVRELAGEGIFAAHINELKQRKMMLLTEIQHRKVRANALRFGAWAQ